MIRILIADDHAIVRKGLTQLIRDEFASAEIAEVGDAEELISKVSDKDWDIVVCDLSMPGRSGLDALRQIKQMHPSLPVLIMSMHDEDQYALRVLKAGASAYLGKDNIHEDIIKAIRTVLLGKKFITPSVAEKLAQALEGDTNQLPHEKLSDREFDVFKLLAGGKAVSDIADQLSLSVTTVSTYRARILEKMNLKSNADLTRYALNNNLI
ncbi:MAG: response regulator transcription factor [Sphingobacteriales bacterium]|nr:response regulator transcription factor [Sphingobacteriales bacterium]OJY85086.1 MAG: DNA-binding response regulator [Sphingobacteriales bacterium 44-15]